MRKCIRCNAEMVENLDVKVAGRADGIKVTEPGLFKDNLGMLKCAVCAECGYTEIYVEDTSKIKKILNKKEK